MLFTLPLSDPDYFDSYPSKVILSFYIDRNIFKLTSSSLFFVIFIIFILFYISPFHFLHLPAATFKTVYKIFFIKTPSVKLIVQHYLNYKPGFKKFSISVLLVLF